MIWNRDRYRRAVQLELHDDVAAALTHFNQSHVPPKLRKHLCHSK